MRPNRGYTIEDPVTPRTWVMSQKQPREAIPRMAQGSGRKSLERILERTGREIRPASPSGTQPKRAGAAGEKKPAP